MKLFVRVAITIALAVGVTFFEFAQNPTESPNPGTQKSILMDHARQHMPGVALSFKQLRLTVAKLIRAHTATAKYRDVRAAERDGYRAIGPEVTGIGIHHVRSDVGEQRVDLDHPPILLYEKNPKVPGGYRLVGVSYLLEAPAGHDGQPTKSPFPEVLAKWHSSPQNETCPIDFLGVRWIGATLRLRVKNVSGTTIVGAKYGMEVFDPTGELLATIADGEPTLTRTSAGTSSRILDPDKEASDGWAVLPYQDNGVGGVKIWIEKLLFRDGDKWRDDGTRRCNYETHELRRKRTKFTSYLKWRGC